MDALRRRDADSLIYKVVNLWPLIAAIAGVISSYAVLSNKVNWTVRVLQSHEHRIKQVEFNAAIARLNTDALAKSLLSSKQQQALRDQTDNLATYVLKVDREGTEQ